MNSEGKDTRVVLQEVIDAAETFEFARVRKDAMAAIDQLKIKGPGIGPQHVVVGNGGTDGAGLGLHRRRRHGPVEVGIPCVLGGAVSGAALKYITPQ